MKRLGMFWLCAVVGMTAMHVMLGGMISDRSYLFILAAVSALGLAAFLRDRSLVFYNQRQKRAKDRQEP